MIELRPYSWALWVCVASTVVGCKEEEPPEDDTLDKGEACDPNAMPPQDGSDTDGDDGPPVCAPGLACEPVDGSDGDYVCGTAVEIRGLVTDSADGSPIEGALVAALNDASEPVTDVVATDSCGYYVLPVSVRRDSNGDFLETPKWTLNVSAQDYLPFPSGVRPALPIDLADAVADPDPPEEEGETDDESYPSDVIENGATSVALIALPSGEQGGSIVSGHVADDVAAGMLVVAEGTGGRAPYGIVDASGNYTLFNVPDGMATIRGYRRGIEVEPTSVMADGSVIEDVDLPVITADEAGLATVDGSLSIVNAPGGSQTSVVLVPTSVYVEELERGPVPAGLRAPAPPQAPSISSTFEITGVPAGSYTVLAGYENDALIRDPDASIAGTQVQQIAVARGATVELESAVRLTAALVLVGPGAEGPELVDGAPTFSWEDDASEDRYSLVVRDARGDEVWRDDELPRVTGVSEVEVPYAGPALTSGMTYQFRVEAWRDNGGEPTVISRTEDLRGVFVAR